MEIEEPIQQLLNNTGWSCEDLLLKLQQYKSLKDNKNETSSEVRANGNVENGKQLSPDKCTVSSTEKIVDTENSDISRVQNIEVSSNPNEKRTETENSSIAINEDFSDTDEEEVEVKATNTNIINEIIDDISSTENSEVIPVTIDPPCQPNISKDETTEVTEVRVIEVDELDDDDDCFDEEGSYRTNNTNKKIEYLETYPRKRLCQPDPNNAEDIVTLTDDSIECTSSKASVHHKFTPFSKQTTDGRMKKGDEEATKQSSSFAYVETFPRNVTPKPDHKNIDEDIFILNNGIIEDNSNCGTSAESQYKQLPEMVSDGNQKTKDDENSKQLCSPKISVKKDIIGSSPEETINSNSDNIQKSPANSTENIDDLRNNLKLQLNSLRTRKKPHFLQDLKSKIRDNMKFNKLVNPVDEGNKSASRDTFHNSTSNSIKENETTNTHEEITNESNPVGPDEHQDDSLYTQTNEFGLVILNVQGGIDIDMETPSCSKTVISENNFNENSSNANDCVSKDSTNCFPESNNKTVDETDTGVFDEIRKIIRKPRSSLNKSKYTFSESTRIEDAIDDSEHNTDNNRPSQSRIAADKLNSSENTNFSAENSLSSIGDDNSQLSGNKYEKNSPFVSNTLEEFLTENSKLNISYKVPKSGAEDGLTESYHEESPLILKKVVKIDEPTVKQKKIETIKAKTVAQKRKLLERQRLKELKKSQQPGTKENKENKEKGPLKKEKIPPIRDSYIMVNNKKLWVKSNTSNKCIAKIMSRKLRPIVLDKCLTNKDNLSLIKSGLRQKKISLLHEMGKRCKEHIKYRPGPLSMKPILQTNGQDSWLTELKKLPDIFLEVTPKIGEPIPPHIVGRLPQHDGRLTENQIEFALSVLKSKETDETKHQTFKFPLAYSNNQKYILVRKEKIIEESLPSKKPLNEQKTDNDIISDVIDDLIKYVEIKEIAPTLIKEDTMDWKDDDSSPSKEPKMMPVISENVSSIFKKPQKRKSKVELELSRLSCKIVNVEVEESLTEDSCNKSYCRLGCICKSLNCDRNLNYHCQRVACMLECTCPKEKPKVCSKLTLPAGTDILSTDTVNRIEDEAKKDLAKVEREFTQTVIHTNDKTIVVGVGGRSKMRRATKAPKKYTDYIDEIQEPAKPQQVVNDIKKDLVRNCFIDLDNLRLPGIIPYCLIHNCYRCKCEEKPSITVSPVKKPRLASLAKRSEEKKEKPEPKEVKRTTTPVENKNEKIEANEKKKVPTPTPKITQPVNKRKHLESKSEEDHEYKSDSSTSLTEKGSHKLENNLLNSRPIRNIKKLKLNEEFSYSDEVFFYVSDCARVRGIPPYIRKRKNVLSSATRRHHQERDFINNITEADVLRASLSDDQQLLEVNLLKNQLVAEAKRNMMAQTLAAGGSSEAKTTHKRKQTLEVRNDDVTVKQGFNQEPAIQRRKKNGLASKGMTAVQPVFDGEIIVDRRNMELLRKMGPKTVAEGYARLLPWKAFIKSFKNDTVRVWCMVDQASRLLLNTSDKPPPENYVNIRDTEPTSEVVEWILNETLPKPQNEDNVSFILKQNKDNYEICGLCAKNFMEESPPVEKSKESTVTDEKQEPEEKDGSQPFRHKDLNGKSQLLYTFENNFTLQELVEENLAGVGDASIERSKLYMWAALPEIYRICKWRMIFLNSDFTYLYFSNIKYSIKYTDLVSVNNMAKTKKSTIILRNSLIQNAYDHSFFGIYFDPHYQDRLFIGPYFKQFTESDIQTLRYINKSLVCTESFNKMQGKTDYKCGHWLVERPYSSKKRPNRLPHTLTQNTNAEAPTIDLTSDNEDYGTMEDREKIREDGFKKPTSTVGDCSKDNVIFLHNDIKIKVMDGVPRNPQDYNRYIITNIPHFGYLGAFQHSTSNEIDVSWPFENKLLRFPSVAAAIQFLRERFSSLLQPIPETFKINVIVLTYIDLKTTRPINVSILTGHYICGTFGCYNVKTITNEFCLDNLGMNKEEVLRIFAKRAQAFIRAKIEELASLLYIPKTQLGSYDIVNILNMAQQEIVKLKSTDKELISTKNDLHLKNRDLAFRLNEWISCLPDPQKTKENLVFREILFSRKTNPPNVTLTEPIEIPDSDDEDNTVDTDKAMPTLQDQSVPEPPRNSLLGMPNLCDQSVPECQINKFLETPNLTDQPPREPQLNSLLSENQMTSSSISPLRLQETSETVSEVPMVSILKESSIPKKVAETATIFPRQKQLRLKSILKPKPSTTVETPAGAPSGTTLKPQISATSKLDGQPLFPNPQFLRGVKIVKTSTGKLLLVSDKTTNNQNTSKVMGTKVIIKNNKILSIKSADSLKQCPQPISVLAHSSRKLEEDKNKQGNKDLIGNCFGFMDDNSNDKEASTSKESNQLNEKIISSDDTVSKSVEHNDKQNDPLICSSNENIAKDSVHLVQENKQNIVKNMEGSIDAQRDKATFEDNNIPANTSTKNATDSDNSKVDKVENVTVKINPYIDNTEICLRDIRKSRSFDYTVANEIEDEKDQKKHVKELGQSMVISEITSHNNSLGLRFRDNLVPDQQFNKVNFSKQNESDLHTGDNQTDRNNASEKCDTLKEATDEDKTNSIINSEISSCLTETKINSENNESSQDESKVILRLKQTNEDIDAETANECKSYCSTSETNDNIKDTSKSRNIPLPRQKESSEAISGQINSEKIKITEKNCDKSENINNLINAEAHSTTNDEIKPSAMLSICDDNSNMQEKQSKQSEDQANICNPLSDNSLENLKTENINDNTVGIEITPTEKNADTKNDMDKNSINEKSEHETNFKTSESLLVGCSSNSENNIPKVRVDNTDDDSADMNNEHTVAANDSKKVIENHSENFSKNKTDSNKSTTDDIECKRDKDKDTRLHTLTEKTSNCTPNLEASVNNDEAKTGSEMNKRLSKMADSDVTDSNMKNCTLDDSTRIAKFGIKSAIENNETGRHCNTAETPVININNEDEISSETIKSGVETVNNADNNANNVSNCSFSDREIAIRKDNSDTNCSDIVPEKETEIVKGQLIKS